MTEDKLYPLQLEDVFFSKIEFSRHHDIREDINIEYIVEINIIETDVHDKVQVNVRIHSKENKLIELLVELVSLFAPTAGKPMPERNKIFEFVNDRGIFILWPYLTQIIYYITSQMGITPLKIHVPFNVRLIDREEEPKG